MLKPGGRVLAIDFGGTAKDRHSFVDHVHRRHGHVDFKDIIVLFTDKGLNITESGDVVCAICSLCSRRPHAVAEEG